VNLYFPSWSGLGQGCFVRLKVNHKFTSCFGHLRGSSLVQINYAVLYTAARMTFFLNGRADISFKSDIEHGHQPQVRLHLLEPFVAGSRVTDGWSIYFS
jgi:hypothetical protein